MTADTQLDAARLCERLPHTGDVCQIESVSHCDEDGIVCLTRAHRRADNPLRVGDRLGVLAGVEMAGQAMALHQALRGDDGPPRTGVVTRAGDLRWQVERLDQLPGPLVIQVTKEVEAGELARYRFSLSHDEQVVVEGRLSVLTTSGEAPTG
ncbi:hypothetical protein [Guyparkeria sp.]|uniref:hypothetical protein n=1 Tax=Guyparkeria sp. TaxID=2035736 RepID=UPI00397105FE